MLEVGRYYIRSPPDRWAIFVVLVDSRGMGAWADTLHTGSAVTGSVLPSLYSHLRRGLSNVLHSDKHIYKKTPWSQRLCTSNTPSIYSKLFPKRKRVVCQSDWDPLVSACVPQIETGEQKYGSGLDSRALICADFRRDPRAGYVSDRVVGPLLPPTARATPTPEWGPFHTPVVTTMQRGSIKIRVVATHFLQCFPG